MIKTDKKTLENCLRFLVKETGVELPVLITSFRSVLTNSMADPDPHYIRSSDPYSDFQMGGSGVFFGVGGDQDLLFELSGSTLFSTLFSVLGSGIVFSNWTDP